MLRYIDTAYLGTGAGVAAKLNKRPVEFPDGSLCAGILHDCTIVSTNESGGALDYKVSDALNVLAFLFGAFSLGFGLRKTEKVDVALPFDRLRELLWATAGHDVLVHTSSGWVEIASLTGSTVLDATVADGATTTLRVAVPRVFYAATLAPEDVYARCPGAAQFRQLDWQVKPAGSYDPNGKWTQAGNIAVNLYAMELDDATHDGSWAGVVRLWQDDTNGRYQKGPPGALLAAWETSAAAASTLLGQISVTDKDGHETQPLADVSAIVEANAYVQPPGYASFVDLNSVATAFIKPRPSSQLSKLPTSGGFTLDDPGKEYQPLHTVWAYFPLSADFQDYGAANLAPSADAAAIATDAVTRPNAPAHVVSTSPVAFVSSSSPTAQAVPSLPVRRGIIGSEPTIPAHVAERVASAKKLGIRSPVLHALPGVAAPSKKGG